MKIKPRFIFDRDAELVNGRLAMLGFTILLGLELLSLSGPIGSVLRLLFFN